MNTQIDAAMARLKSESFVEFCNCIINMSVSELYELRKLIQISKKELTLRDPETHRPWRVFSIAEAILSQEWAARERSEKRTEDQKRAICTPLSEG